MNKIYCDIKEFVTAVLSDQDNEKFCDKEFHSALWNGLPMVAGRNQELFNEIFFAFNQGFSDVPGDVWKD